MAHDGELLAAECGNLKIFMSWAVVTASYFETRSCTFVSSLLVCTTRERNRLCWESIDCYPKLQVHCFHKG